MAVSVRRSYSVPGGPVEACLRRVNDAEVMMLAKILDCKITDLFPANTKTVLTVLRHSK